MQCDRAYLQNYKEGNNIGRRLPRSKTLHGGKLRRRNEAAELQFTGEVRTHPMEGMGGGDLVSDLQGQVLCLRKRVEELERESERLRFQLSRCRCSKTNVEISADACISYQETFQKANKGNAVEQTEHSKGATSCLSDHLATSLSNPVEDGCKPSTRLIYDNTMLTKHEPREKPDHLKNIHHHTRRYIALKIMYFGQRFYGFSSEGQMDPTVESEIFKAFERTKLLVGTREESRYSRCGRTDKGVSATGQVISLYLRSNLKEIGGNTENKTTVIEGKREIDYVRVLNRVLPGDIRVVGWCPVPLDFHSRFSCLSRQYRYLFWKGDMDILAMQQAAKKFVGEYDFRNFCKMDAANVNNYRRRITFFDISSLDERYNDDELWVMTIKGSAFLWHQVRCMVAVLFMIGQRLESPEVIDVLLDISKTCRKPQYNMAPELPLILQCCEFESLEFICSSDASQALHEQLTSEVQRYMLQATIFIEAISCLSTPGQSPESLRKNKGHIPLLLRVTEPSYEERRAKLSMKATHKG
ncbi:tRNA pseudouridine(38/39) synthase isoform X2 [Canna indica]|uniref:tRNA pseudouridine(38/39) synthase isoform X2 n=1 Tax=Canna indica TaxID=4628 RepID=A0AAQ3KSQ8_9LILI|nr:tRNA pseudouridine(38/39) synthase isoform X2 [Canna indica]